MTDPSVQPSSYILYECVHVTESGRGDPKISGALRAPVTEPPFLNFYIRHCYGPFSPGTRIVLYADDILFYRTILSNSYYSYLQSDANTVQDWVNCNHMSLNPSKCKFMLISRKCNRINNPPTLTINGQILESVIHLSI